jgi:putative ABC transport system ATP-binding protein
MTAAPALVAETLVRRYGDRTVIDRVSLAVANGESVSLMGTSGCGKTTLLHMLATLDRPDEGRVLIAGTDPTRMSGTARAILRREHIGMVFQQSNLLPGLTARENIALPCWRATGARREAFARADALLARFGLAARRHAGAAVLSLGEAQRVAVARALINHPALVFADEPTGSLDSESTVAVLDALGEVCATGAALVMVTHDPAVAARCGRRLVLHDGRLQTDDTLTPPLARAAGER